MNWFSSESVLPSDKDLIDYVDKFVKQLIIYGTTDDRQFNCAMCEAIQYIIDNCQNNQTYNQTYFDC